MLTKNSTYAHNGIGTVFLSIRPHIPPRTIIHHIHTMDILTTIKISLKKADAHQRQHLIIPSEFLNSNDIHQNYFPVYRIGW
jgi:hypothetical protein